MSSGSKNTTTKTANDTTTPTVPDYISQPYQGYLGQVNNLAGMSGSDFTTPATNNQRSAFTGASALSSSPGNAALMALLNYTPQNVTSGSYDPALLKNVNLDPYMNPFQKDVTDTTINDWQDANGQALNALRSSTPTGAFGGSRAGVAEGTLVGNNSRTLASTLAGLNTANFSQAQQAAAGDVSARNAGSQFNISNALQAALANQSAGFTGANFRLNAANALDANSRANLSTQADLGAQERGINQDNNPNVAQLDLMRALQSLYGMSPGMFVGSSSQGTQTSTQQQNPGFFDALGTILGGLGDIGFNPFKPK